jgi:hypothetical protein
MLYTLQGYFFMLFIALCLVSSNIYAQYELIGGASKLDKDRYRLTRKLHDSQAAIWRKKKLDLKMPFDIKFEAFLGCKFADSDGLAFVLQQEGDDVNGGGSYGLGYSGLQPSLAVEIDNFPDAFEGVDSLKYAHIAITKNGDIDHHSPNNLAGPVTANPDKEYSKENCRRYIVQIAWRPDQKRLSVKIDDEWRLTYKGDIIKNIFKNNSMVWMGFTAATSSERFNTQGVRILPVTLPQDEPPAKDISPEPILIAQKPPMKRGLDALKERQRKLENNSMVPNAPDLNTANKLDSPLPPQKNIPKAEEPPLDIPVLKHPSHYRNNNPTTSIELTTSDLAKPIGDPTLPPELKDIKISYTERKIPEILGGRPVYKSNEVFVKNEKIEIWVRDNETEDGDTISLFFNGEWVLYRQPLLTLKRSISVSIQRNADNYLILYAHNEGRIPPNTAAIGIVDKGREMRLAMSSTMNSCDAIKLRFEE